MSERTKLGLLCFLLLLVLVLVAISAANTFQAVKSFQQQYSGAKQGDVTTIRPWMTLHVISHVYHVPEDYLDSSLKIAKTDPLHKATLYEIASHRKQPINHLIYTLQSIILVYRKNHRSSPTPSQSVNKLLLLRAGEG